VRSAFINKENMIEYKVALVPKDEIITLAQFDKCTANNQNKYKKKNKSNNKRCKK
jgi:hypothetical protein